MNKFERPEALIEELKKLIHVDLNQFIDIQDGLEYKRGYYDAQRRLAKDLEGVYDLLYVGTKGERKLIINGKNFTTKEEYISYPEILEMANKKFKIGYTISYRDLSGHEYSGSVINGQSVYVPRSGLLIECCMTDNT